MTRNFRTLAFALAVVILSSSLPAMALEPQTDPRMRDRATPIVIIKRIVKRLFGISTNEDISIPKP